MKKDDLLEKCDEAIAACLEEVKRRAEKQEANAAQGFAAAAYTVSNTRHDIECRTEVE